MPEQESKSEFALIDWIHRHQSALPDHITKGIGDDMAILDYNGQPVLVTTDMLLDGIHFDLTQCSLEQAGYKAMACSLSDCAAMACWPSGAVIAVALPQSMTMANCRTLYQGLETAAQRFNCPIIGGDTTSWNKPLAITVTMLGTMRADQLPIYRSGAQAGDAIFVTGTLGGSLAGRHLSFTPRLNEAQQLRSLVSIHAMLDLSDGLSSDLAHICRASGVHAVLDPSAIPISPPAYNSPDPLLSALQDGEDFELLFCVSAADAQKLQNRWAQISDLQCTRIGQIISPILESKVTSTVFLRDSQNNLTPLQPGGWEHFRESE